MPHILHPYKNALFGSGVSVSATVAQSFVTTPSLPAWLDISGNTGNRMLYDNTGKLTYAPNNLLISTATLSTQSATVVIGVNYIVSFFGTGSVTLSGAATATINGTGAANRVSQVITATTTTLTLTVTGSVTSAQLEAVTYQTSPSTYVATTAAAYYGPRFDFDPNSLNSNGLLVEDSITNIALNSEAMGSWTANGSTVTNDTLVSPNGLQTADTITETVVTGGHTRSQNITVTNATVYTYSVYAQKGERTWLVMGTVGAGTGYTFFDLTNGVVGTKLAAHTTATITNVGGGWYRCSITFTTTTTTLTVHVGMGQANTVSTYTGDGTSRIYAWGAQVELGTFASSYIPTTSASLTRTADDVKLGGTFLSTIGGAAGTVVQEMTLLGNRSVNQYGIYGNTVGPIYFDSTLAVSATNGTNVLASGTTATASVPVRAGLAWDGSGRAISVNGGAAVTDANTFGTIGATVYVGSNNGANVPNGWVRALGIYNTKLSGSTLTTKTTVGVLL